MRAPTSRDRDQRATDREFRSLTRQLRRTSPVTRRWAMGPLDARDVRITGHEDRRCPPVIAAATGSLLLAIATLVAGDASVAVGMAVVGLLSCSAIGHDQARTSLTVTTDGHVVIGNGLLRRTVSVPAVAVARVSVPHLSRSRWDPRRPVGHVLLHSGELLPVRALAYDPSRDGEHARASALLRTVVKALSDAGAALERRRI